MKAYSITDIENNWEYMVIVVTDKIFAGTNKTFRINSLINTPYSNSQA